VDGLLSIWITAQERSISEISEWVADEADELSAKLDSLIEKGVYA